MPSPDVAIKVECDHAWLVNRSVIDPPHYHCGIKFQRCPVQDGGGCLVEAALCEVNHNIPSPELTPGGDPGQTLWRKSQTFAAGSSILIKYSRKGLTNTI